MSIRKSRVVLRVYERELYDDERGRALKYLVGTFGLSQLDKYLVAHVLRSHFEGGIALEEDVPYAVWQASSGEDWEQFAGKPLNEWSALQRTAYEHIVQSIEIGGNQMTIRDTKEQAMVFADGYEEGYKQAQKDWGLPIKSALFPEENVG